MAESGVLLRLPAGNQVLYQANRDCSIYPELAGLFRKTAGLVDVLREALAPLGDAVEIAFVFGSIAEGKERDTSDVDVFVVGTAPFARVVKALAGAHERLGREVSPVALPRDVVVEKICEHDRFVTRVSGEPKLFIARDHRP